MKIQDLLFFILFVILVFTKQSKMSTLAGILCLIIAIPLFSRWIFFTAERLTWYAAGFFLLAAIFEFYIIRREYENRN